MNIVSMTIFYVLIAVVFLTHAASAQCGSTQLVADSYTQYLTSPGYPGTYPNDINCEWRIVTYETAALIQLSLLNMSLENVDNCIYDYVSIFDGFSTWNNILDTMCGYVSSLMFTSTGSVMTIIFHSDVSRGYGGFKFAYHTVNKTGQSLWATYADQYLTSPGYSLYYPNNALYYWTITADSPSKYVVLKVLDFQLQGETFATTSSRKCIYDSLSIYNGIASEPSRLETLCGQQYQLMITSNRSMMTLVFQSDASIQYRGFEIQYTSQGLYTDENLVADISRRYFNSPNYPLGYPSNSLYRWNITSYSLDKAIVLTALDFDIGTSTSCSYGHVNIYDGSNPLYQPVAKLCGQLNETTFASTGRLMTVEFASDSSHTNRGFNFTYTLQDQCTNKQLFATEAAQYITSIGYPYSSPSNTHCEWHITAPSSKMLLVLKVLDFHLDNSSCKNDYVTIYDGDSTVSNLLQKLCGQLPETTYISNGSYMTVVFQSGYSTTNKRFRIQYTSQNKTALCGSTLLYATATAQYLTSYGYPNNYPSDFDCQWKISTSSQYVVRLNLIDVRLDYSIASLCIDDYLSFYDGNSTSSNKIKTVCSTSNVNITSTSSAITVVFHSDGSYSYTGFKLQYTSIDKSALCGSALLYASETQQYLTSYGYPNNYPSGMDCQWRISTSFYYVIQINLTDVRLDDGLTKSCSNDYISIYDGDSTNSIKKDALCQTSNYDITSTSNIVTVVFHSDSSISYTGFKLQYASIDKPVPCESNTAYSTYSIQQINSPNYPDLYPSNSDCEWLVYRINGEAISLNVSIIKLERDDNYCIDFVAIYDGPKTNSTRVALLCGDANVETYKITSQYMAVVFHSDWSLNYGGFSISFTSTHFEEYDYTTKYFNPRSDDQSTNASGVSPGGIVIICSCIAFALAVLGFVALCVRRRKARKNTRNSAVRSQQNNSNSRHQSTPRRQNTQETSLSNVSPASTNSLVTATAPPYAELPRPRQNTATSNIYESISRFFNNATRNPSRPPRANTPTSTSITNQRPQSSARTNAAFDFSNRTELARRSILRENIYGEILATSNSRPAVDTSNPPSYAEATASGSNMTIPARCDGEPMYEYLVVKVRRNK